MASDAIRILHSSATLRLSSRSRCAVVGLGPWPWQCHPCARPCCQQLRREGHYGQTAFGQLSADGLLDNAKGICGKVFVFAIAHGTIMPRAGDALLVARISNCTGTTSPLYLLPTHPLHILALVCPPMPDAPCKCPRILLQAAREPGSPTRAVVARGGV